MTDATEQLRRVWNQTTTPVLLNRGKRGPPRMRLPPSVSNRAWLQNGRRRLPTWHAQDRYWSVPRPWFSDLVARCILRFGAVYVIQPYRQKEVCAPACWKARREECECSCMGHNHGRGRPAGYWKILSEAFAVRWDGAEWACRLLSHD